MLKGWLRKDEDTSSQSVNSSTEPQRCMFLGLPKFSQPTNTGSSGGGHARYDVGDPERYGEQT